MTRKLLNAQSQPERTSKEVHDANERKEPAATFSSRRGSRSLLRDLNVSLLIELVRRAGTISRADLARQSSLSAPTVSTIVENLIGRGILNEVSMAPSSGGRPPVLLSIDPKAGYVIGIKLRADGVTTVVCDLDAQVVASSEAAELLVGNPEAAILAIERETRRVMRKAAVPPSKVLGVGIGLPGIIETDRGVCNFSHLLWWRDVDIAGPLRKKLGMPVWVDNDVNTLAVAEKWSGDASDARDFVTLSVGRGIGLGIMIDRSLYRGANGAAGEFGHIIIEPGGPKCECGKSGCLEAIVGEKVLRQAIGERLGRDITRADLIELLQVGDTAALEVVDNAGRRLGTAVANMMTLLNPELLIICGEGTELGPTFLDPIIAAVREQTFGDLGRKAEVKVQRWGDEVWAVGAATLVLRESFSLPAADEKSHAIWNRVDA